MTKIAVYARYSSDLQKDNSIEDQLRVCRDKADREGWEIVETYTDHAISGTSLIRPGIQALMEDARNGRFDLVLSEALDRISRDQEDIAHVHKRLNFLRIQMFTLSEGKIGDTEVGVKGMVNKMYVKDLKQKVRRGQRGRVENGYVTAGLCYGYDVVKKFDSNGEPVRGERTINEQEADIVRRIFREYAGGKSPRAIAVGLNKDGIPSPSGKKWGQSSINGHRARGTGILNNEFYAGRIVWNRVTEDRDPDTGSRRVTVNPKEEWVIKEAPELRIVDDSMWEAVTQRKDALAQKRDTFWKAQRPRYLLSGLIKCGECGGGFAKAGHDRYACSTRRDKGSCDNKLTIKQEELEEIVIGSLHKHLMVPKLLDVFCKEYTKQMNELRRQTNAERERYKSELLQLEKSRQKLIDAIKDGVPGSVVKDEIIAVTERREELEDLLENTDEAPAILHPTMADHYQREITSLISALKADDTKSEAIELLRSLIEKIVLTPNKARDKLVIDLFGDLGGILAVAKEKENSMEYRCAAVPGVKLVGPEGLEPPT